MSSAARLLGPSASQLPNSPPSGRSNAAWARRGTPGDQNVSASDSFCSHGILGFFFTVMNVAVATSQDSE